MAIGDRYIFVLVNGHRIRGHWQKENLGLARISSPEFLPVGGSPIPADPQPVSGDFFINMNHVTHYWRVN